MARKEYDTRQREALLAFFAARPEGCFSAADILAERSLCMGKATVYRLLARFTEEGLLVRYLSSGERGALYQYRREACGGHFHLKCARCGRLIHMDCAFMRDMQAHIRQEHGFAVDNGRTTIYGVCGDCGAGV